MFTGFAIGEFKMELYQWEKSVSSITRKYNHFDLWTSYNSVRHYILDCSKVQKHGFYPLIHFEMPKPKWIKYKGKAKVNTEKKRDIFYAAHIDSWIYRYYAYLINKFYNSYTIENGIDGVSVAYRNNKPGQNNITFANNAFSFIRDCQRTYKKAYVIIGDFTDFFDNLNHKCLKERLQLVLGQEKLSPDMYAVFKNITRATYVELNDILDLHKLKHTDKSRRIVNKDTFNNGRILDIRKLKINKVEIHKEKCNAGVAQGTPISAVLSNIYMIHFDKSLNELAKSVNGFYQRYSDDFIFIFPETQDSYRIVELINRIREYVSNTKGLTLKDEKRQIFKIDGCSINNITESFLDDSEPETNTHDSTLINYLGFSYDGVKIFVRAKTLSRYFSKMAISAHAIARQNGITHPKRSKVKSKKIPLYKVFDRFTYKGMKSYRRKHSSKKHVAVIANNNGNFHDYVERAQRAFSADVHIANVTKKSIVYLRKRLKKKYEESHS